jgi:hypothetical protein
MTSFAHERALTELVGWRWRWLDAEAQWLWTRGRQQREQRHAVQRRRGRETRYSRRRRAGGSKERGIRGIESCMEKGRSDVEERGRLGEAYTGAHDVWPMQQQRCERATREAQALVGGSVAGAARA